MACELHLLAGVERLTLRFVYNKEDSNINKTGSYDEVLKKLEEFGFEWFYNGNPKHYGGTDYQGVVNGNWYHVTVGYTLRVWGATMPGIPPSQIIDGSQKPKWITVHCEAGKPSYLFYP